MSRELKIALAILTRAFLCYMAKVGLHVSPTLEMRRLGLNGG